MIVDDEQIFRRFHEENRRLTGGQSRFDEAESAEKMPTNASVLGVKKYQSVEKQVFNRLVFSAPLLYHPFFPVNTVSHP